jgi:hypothetical protein
MGVSTSVSNCPRKVRQVGIYPTSRLLYGCAKEDRCREEIWDTDAEEVDQRSFRPIEQGAMRALRI